MVMVWRAASNFSTPPLFVMAGKICRSVLVYWSNISRGVDTRKKIGGNTRRGDNQDLKFSMFSVHGSIFSFKNDRFEC